MSVPAGLVLTLLDSLAQRGTVEEVKALLATKEWTAEEKYHALFVAEEAENWDVVYFLDSQ